MNLIDYQKSAWETAVYPGKGSGDLRYAALGLAGEAGEVAEKVKKIFRDADNAPDADRKQALASEMGDVLWYLAALATELGVDLSSVASSNINKLFSRKNRGTLHGDGDER